MNGCHASSVSTKIGFIMGGNPVYGKLSVVLGWRLGGACNPIGTECQEERYCFGFGSLVILA
jgi:hypothetical protein